MTSSGRSSGPGPVGTDSAGRQAGGPRAGLTRRALLRSAAVAAVGAAGAAGFGVGRVTAPGAELPDWTTADIPSQAGRRALVTGGNGYPRDGRSGLGYHEALALAVAGADVTIASRDGQRGEEAVRRIRAASPGATVRFEELDLTDLSSVAALVTRMESTGDRLDVLVNNAGVQGRLEREEAADGTERVFATNARGPFALTALLRPLLQEADAPRVVWTSSSRVGPVDLDDLGSERSYDHGAAYEATKLGALLMALELQRRSTAGGWGITSTACHPGVCRTNIVLDGPGPDSPEGLRFRYVRPLWQDPAVGALPALYAATSPTAPGGAYYGPKELGGLRGLPGFAVVPEPAQDLELAARYWEALEDLTGVPVS